MTNLTPVIPRTPSDFQALDLAIAAGCTNAQAVNRLRISGVSRLTADGCCVACGLRISLDTCLECGQTLDPFSLDEHEERSWR